MAWPKCMAEVTDGSPCRMDPYEVGSRSVGTLVQRKAKKEARLYCANSGQHCVMSDAPWNVEGGK